MPLYTAATAEQVRAVIGVDLSSTEISDDVIGLPVYAGAAQAELLLLDPLASTYTTDPKLGNAQRALIYLIAARIAPTISPVQSEQLGDYRYTMQPYDGEKDAARLRGLANEAIAANITTSGMISPPTIFATVRGQRGR